MLGKYVFKPASHLALLAIALASLWFAGYLGFAAWVAGMKPVGMDRATDAVIVLTGGARRINTGLDLLAEGHAPQLYISGVNKAVSLKEILDRWQSNGRNKDAAACCVVLDYKARNTEQNASETRAWIDREQIKSLRLVTSSYHMPRAWLEFRDVLPDVEIVPYPVPSLDTDLKSGRFWTITFIEYHKILLTLARTSFRPLFRTSRVP